MTKPKTPAPPSAGGNAAPTEQPTFRTNPEVDAKIDAYIKDNPKYWAYVQAMPRERLERTWSSTRCANSTASNASGKAS